MRSAWSLLRRGLGLFIAFGLLTSMGCGPAPAAPVKKMTPPPVRVASSSWESLSLPLSGTPLLFYTVSPTDPATMYACTSTPAAPGTSASAVPILLWRTQDAGQHWSHLPLPSTLGTNCSLSIAPDQPQRIAYLVTNASDDQRPCDRDSLYLSPDGGATWRHIPHTSVAPPGASPSTCQVIVTSQQLYLWSSYGGGQDSPQASLLERTDDDGATWFRADTDFGPGVLFFPPQLGEQDTLATVVRPATLSASESQSVLWMSHDAGRSWQQVGAIPAPAGIFLLTTPQLGSIWPAPAAPFYTLVQEQLPSNLYRLQVLQSVNGHHWNFLAPLPVPRASAAHPGLLQALAITNAGTLLAFGADPQTGVPDPASAEPGPTPAFWLWIWDPHTGRWLVLTSPLNDPAGVGCGLCWSGVLSTGQDYLTSLVVYHWGDESHLFRILLPDVTAF